MSSQWLNSDQLESELKYLLAEPGGGRRFKGVRWRSTAVDHASPEQSHDKAKEAGEDGEQREGASRLDV